VPSRETTSSSRSSGALEAVERILNRGGDPDDVLRQVVETLHERAAAWVGIAFVEEGRLELGPSAGAAKPNELQRHSVEWEARTIAELWASLEADPELLSRVAVIVSPYCLVGWDTGGETWDP
jgi:hypothetical protein